MVREEHFVFKRAAPETLDERVLKFIETDEITRKLNLMIETQLRLAYLKGDIPPRAGHFFHHPYQYKTLDAGKSGVVWSLDIPGDLKGGIITHVGNNWFADTYWEWEVDYEPVVEPKIERKLAKVDDPKYVRIFVKDHIEWRAYNQSTSTHDFEVLCDGFYIPLKKLV